MINVVKILSSSINQGKRVLKFLRYGRQDVQTSVEVMPFGVDSNPVKDMVAIYSETAQNGKTVIIGYINKNQVAEIGGFRTYSTDADGNVTGYTYLRSNGDLELLGNTNFAVKYNELKVGFDTLRSDLNSLITNFNSHTHLYAPGPSTPVPSATPIPTGTPSVASIDNSKNDKIKTNG